MKKLLVIAVATLALAACTQERIIVPADSGLTSLTASHVSTRSALKVTEGETPSYSILWNAPDSILVGYAGGELATFTSKNESPAAEATFTGKLPDGSGELCAIYPEEDGNSVEADGTYKIIMHTVQTAVEGSYDPMAFPAIAQSESKNLSFMNVFGLLELTVGYEDVTSISFGARVTDVEITPRTRKTAEPIVMSVQLTNGEPKIVKFENNSEATGFTLYPPKGSECFKIDTPYYLAVHPIDGWLLGRYPAFWLSHSDGTVTEIVLDSQPVLERSKVHKVKRLFLEEITPDEPEPEETCNLVINEASLHTSFDNSWIELFNPSENTVATDGVILRVNCGAANYPISIGSAEIKSGEYLVLSLSLDELSSVDLGDVASFYLEKGDQTLDTFEISKTLPALSIRGSYQRLPDGSGKWRALTYPTKGKENGYDLSKNGNTAIWMYGNAVSTVMANDASGLKNLKAKGYRHIFLYFYAIAQNGGNKVRQFVETCEMNDISVHIWIPTFYSGGEWINPVENGSPNENYFNSLAQNAKDYIEELGVKGIVLEYLRYPGNAYNTEGGAEAITRCCEVISDMIKDYDEGLVLSVTLMPETIDNIYYYGQDTNALSQFAQVLIPLLYRNDYHAELDWYEPTANWYTDEVDGHAEVWPALLTYHSYEDDSALNEEEFMIEWDALKGAHFSGLCLYRYGLGLLPDVSDLTIGVNTN